MVAPADAGTTIVNNAVLTVRTVETEPQAFQAADPAEVEILAAGRVRGPAAPGAVPRSFSLTQRTDTERRARLPSVQESASDNTIAGDRLSGFGCRPSAPRLQSLEQLDPAMLNLSPRTERQLRPGDEATSNSVLAGVTSFCEGGATLSG